MVPNQNPEQISRDNIDDLLKESGLSVQNKNKIDLNKGLRQAIREYQTDVDPADYVLIVGKKAVVVNEAKREEVAQNITVVEKQTEYYAAAKLIWVGRLVPTGVAHMATISILANELCARSCDHLYMVLNDPIKKFNNLDIY